MTMNVNWIRYKRLRDSDTGVRKNTLMVLSHLILNDMLKAKGPVTEIAKCLQDSETRISDLV
jgi:condensin complex subunit 1